jgi:membrane protein implicated in regulation of membrane protease activity
MTLETFFLICFGVGFVFSLVSFFAGGLHLHLPTRFHFDFGHHGHVPHAHAGSAGHAAHGGAHLDFTQVSPFNVPSIMAFLAWFGGVGYLMSHNFNAGLGSTIVVSLAGGLAGGFIVFMFLSKLASYDGSLDPADDEMVGVIANVDSAIREGGTGEIVYSVRGIRHACGARAEDGSAISKGAEVVVTRFENGIAYVRHWEEFSESGSASNAAKG